MTYFNHLGDNYYNEIDLGAAQWLRNLIAAGHIAPGVVDTRSIEDVTPDDLRGFTQCHFFAGIGGWALALRSAGWADDRPVWTSSCPCQPFSAAGAGAGFADERHLWPSCHHLVAERRPASLIGEQVAGPAVDPWIDLVQSDMEALGYRFGAVAFPAAGVGAPHLRDRAYWAAQNLAYPESQRREGVRRRAAHQDQRGTAERGGHGRMARPEISGWGQECENRGGRAFGDTAQGESAGSVHGCPDSGPGPVNGYWRDADWISCRDQRWRAIESGARPLAYGVPARVVKLRAYGNAICVEAARVFIETLMECTI